MSDFFELPQGGGQGERERQESPGYPTNGEGSGPTPDPLAKPIALAPRFEGIPDELKAIPNWVLWKYEPPKKPNGKWGKVPYQPNGYKADTTNPRTWSTFELACAVYQQGSYDGVGFCFDEEAIDSDGYCRVGIDFDHCIDDKGVQPVAGKWVIQLDTYTELSPSGTGFHAISRAKPLDRPLKFGGVEVYCRGRYFTFTGRCLTGGQQIRAAPAEVDALIAETRAREAASSQNKSKAPAGILGGAKVSPVFAHLKPKNTLGGGIEDHWFNLLQPEHKDEVVDYALGVIASNTTILELEDVPKGIGDNYQWYRLVTSVARSGAPHAEDIFVKYASKAADADPEDALRQKFAICQKPSPRSVGITVGTLLHLAQEHGADFRQWRDREQKPQPAELPPIAWDPATLKASFTNIPHRQWIYGTYLIRGEVTLLVSPGGVGKTALATGMGCEIATDTMLLDEMIWGNDLKVLSINGEDGKNEAERRTLAFLRAHRQKEEPPDRLYILGSDDPRVQQMSFLQTNKRGTATLNMDGFAVLESGLDALRPDVLIIDPLVVFCGGVNMNDNAMMAMVIRVLKAMAVEYKCAIMVVHHTKKGGEPGDQESISGAAAIANLARRAIMPVPMTAGEAQELRVLPSMRGRYFKLMDAKASFAPKSADSPWYELHNIELSNPEPPLYLSGDRVQAVGRVTLPLPKTATEAADDQKVQRAILDTVHRGKLVDGVRVPYSPHVTGAKNQRSLLDDAMPAVAVATAPRQWAAKDLQAVVYAAIDQMKKDQWLYEDKIKGGRFRQNLALYVRWQNTPWPDQASTTSDDPKKE